MKVRSRFLKAILLFPGKNLFWFKPYETKRLVVDEFQAVRAEKISRYNPLSYGDTDVHFSGISLFLGISFSPLK